MDRPQQLEPKSLSDYLAVMARAIFTAGMNWKVVSAKWEGTLTAFDSFDPKKVAAYTPDDVERLMADPGIIRNRKKIEAIIYNAGEMIVVDREYGGFGHYRESFADSDALLEDLHRRFKFLGESVAHIFLYGVSFRPRDQELWAHHFMQERATRARR